MVVLETIQLPLVHLGEPVVDGPSHDDPAYSSLSRNSELSMSVSLARLSMTSSIWSPEPHIGLLY